MGVDPADKPGTVKGRLRRRPSPHIGAAQVFFPFFKLCQAKAEKIIRLPEREFEQFLKSPMEYQDFIKEDVDLMRQDESGVYHPGIFPLPRSGPQSCRPPWPRREAARFPALPARILQAHRCAGRWPCPRP